MSLMEQISYGGFVQIRRVYTKRVCFPVLIYSCVTIIGLYCQDIDFYLSALMF